MSCVYGCFVCNICICVHHVHELSSEAREGSGPPETGATDSCEPSMWEDAKNRTQVLWNRSQ